MYGRHLANTTIYNKNKNKSWKVNKEVASPESKEHGLVKVDLKSWKMGLSQAKKGEFKKERKK